MVNFLGFRGLALAAAVVMAFSAPLSAAEHEEGQALYGEAVAAALAGDPGAREALMELFESLRGNNDAIADLEAAMIWALDGETEAVIDAATLIADVASEYRTDQSSAGDYEELLAAVLAGDPNARDDLLALFSEVSDDSEAIAGLAVELILSLKGEAVEVIDAATFIAEVASEFLTAQPETTFNDDQILTAEAIIAQAIGATLETLATAAGDEGAVDDIIDLDQVATEATDAISPS